MTAPPVFDRDFRARFETLLRWRRDVRRFRTDALAPGLLDHLLVLADLAPSVGNCQPWRFVTVDDPARRARIRANFERANAEALADYAGERAALYARLKLAGLVEAPVHLAVFADMAPDQGQGLGRRTMPATIEHSATTAVHTLWLAARAHGVGVGWVSILDPLTVNDDLDCDPGWHLIAYLCIGHPVEEHEDPELERHGWQARTPLDGRRLRR
ncbi:5,6-dimethylbenzimidazole synthase [Zavarzinia compransoris]|uniref:5,6-dimethylbenzimidazole synthase n=1 Tax=Zavarzinia compransoris TaxID=1264899 RepID=A0A317DZI4_9PROT|nr:5,6-dimethylbenzimidazole synthase [Zavarzinia compransoris]PWR19624.1 5,6-dimethylbenzimidazole synthase [Zavarzinia compransoris]TDP40390.1 cob(II)yrinic acid a,c-diamide reductase [Zavarzinia compransoris]